MSAEVLREAAEEIRDDKTPLHRADELTSEDRAWLAVADWLEYVADQGDRAAINHRARALAVARAYLGG